MSQGWIKLHRSILDSSLWFHPNAYVLFSYLLMKASHSERRFPFNGSDLELKPGQLISSHDSIKTGLTGTLSLQQIRTSLEYLKSTGRITVKTNNKFSVITITNWEKYQADNRQDNNPVTGEQQASNKPVTTNKNVRTKELKNEEEVKKIDLVQYGKFLRMESAQMDKLIAKYTQPLIQQELEGADEWIEHATKPTARQYRKPAHNHYLFFSSWLSDKSLRSQKGAKREPPKAFNIRNEEAALAVVAHFEAEERERQRILEIENVGK